MPDPEKPVHFNSSYLPHIFGDACGQVAVKSFLDIWKPFRNCRTPITEPFTLVSDRTRGQKPKPVGST
ncbi:hypothetical protein QR680_006426 [Steinernema hermaphroditum]|uniref:Uncharacterized protein n=1 Tax=Steinernema hermaphroditum TaxID=289476 RepID=A0AA39LX43_9BILA|nr:hypothetical protein QR680_006426 [Steinernema hermaphroditum]